MKEKTFEELLTDDNDFAPANFTRNQVLKLLQQVREATIAECKDLIWDEYGLYRKAYEIEAEFDNLPTDRIRIEP